VIPIKAGDFIELQCPEQSVPLLSLGQRIPEITPSFVVIRIEGSSIYLGPLKTGVHEINVPCSQDKNIQTTIQLAPTPKEQMPEPEGPIGFIMFAHPIWLWIALALLTALLVGFLWWLIRAIRKKQLAKKLAHQPDEGFIDAVAEFKNMLERYRKLGTDSPAPASLVESFFSEAQAALRAYLEVRLHFKARWATTIEFLGQLKAASISYSGLKDLQFKVESFLHQADLVRFSKNIPTASMRIKHHQDLNEIFNAIESVTAKVEKSQ